MSELTGLNTAQLLFNAPNIVCECGNKTFVSKSILKRLSSLYTGTGKDEVVDVPVWVCDKCGKIPTEFMKNEDFKRLIGEKEESKSNLIVI